MAFQWTPGTKGSTNFIPVRPRVSMFSSITANPAKCRQLVKLIGALARIGFTYQFGIISHESNNISCLFVSGCKKCSFFGKFGVLCSFVTSVLRFVLFPYYQRTVVIINAISYFTYKFSWYISISLFCLCYLKVCFISLSLCDIVMRGMRSSFFSELVMYS